jgi:predicted XRE-type DNA-binding protein
MDRPYDDLILAIRQQLAAEIVRSLGEGAQHTIAPTFGIPQPRMSELNRGVVDHCSVEWLIRRIYALGGTVTVTVTLGDAGRAWMRDRMSRMRAARRARAGAKSG